jgi:hypothetical protein
VQAEEALTRMDLRRFFFKHDASELFDVVPPSDAELEGELTAPFSTIGSDRYNGSPPSVAFCAALALRLLCASASDPTHQKC